MCPTKPAPTAHLVPSNPTAPPPWYADQGELSETAAALTEVFGWDVDALLRFVEKPWKWTPERDRWVALGRPDPTTLDTDDLEVDS